MAPKSPQASLTRPPISVLVPFRGDYLAARRAAANLARLQLGDGDEVIVADNTDDQILGAGAIGAARVIPATEERSSYHARNAGARAAGNRWLLFMDADCEPEPDLLDAFLADPISARCGALSGAIRHDPSQRGLLARYARSRHFLSAEEGLLGTQIPLAGNLLVRREAFDAVGGFATGIRSGGDVDLARRLRAAGWEIAHRPRARVTHPHREELVGFLAMVSRYGAGARWLNHRYPGSSPPWPLREGLAAVLRDVAGLGLGGNREAALFRALDGVGLLAHSLGYRTSNLAPRRPR
jgi:GT2 family glycosyltransferase